MLRLRNNERIMWSKKSHSVGGVKSKRRVIRPRVIRKNRLSPKFVQTRIGIPFVPFSIA